MWIIGIVLVFAFSIFLLLQVPTVQGFVKDIAVNYLSKKLQTKVQLARLYIDFPSSIELDSLYVQDRQGDTLVYSHKLYVETSMLEILSGNIEIKQLTVDHFTANVNRTLPDTTFNFDFIMRAFSSDKPSVPDTSSSSTRFSIHDIDLSHIHLKYNDVVTGNDVNVYLGKFKTRFSVFNLENRLFQADSITLADVNADVVQSAPLIREPVSVTPDTGQVIMPDLFFKELAFKSIFIHYNNKAAGMSGILNLGEFQIIPNEIDLRKKYIDVKNLALINTHIVFDQYKGSQSKIADTVVAPDSISEGSWIFKVNKLLIAGNDLKYDDQQKPEAQKGIDYNHLVVQNLNIDVNDGFYSADSSHALINNISLKEKSGFDLKRLTTKATYTDHGAELAGLDIITANSHITKNLAISYASLKSLGENPGDMGIHADLADCVVDLNDVLYFQPSLDSAESMRKLMHSTVKVNGIVDGKLSDLNINDLEMQTAKQTHLAVKAHISGLPDMHKTVFNINLKDFTTGRNDLYALLPRNMFPQNINIPSRLKINGTYRGSMNSFNSRVNIISTYGNISAEGGVKNLKDSLKATYQALVKANRLNLGKLLKNDTMYGSVTLQTTVKGQGLTKSSAAAQLKGNIQQAEIKGYNYRNLNFSGNYQQEKGKLNMHLKDPNLQFQLISSADLSGKYPAVKLDLDLDSADLYALHFSPDTLKFRGKVKADFSTADIDHLNGRLLMTSLQVVKNSKRIDLDTVALDAISSDTLDSLHLEAPFAMANISGHYQFSKTGLLIRSLMQHYFGSDSTTQAVTDSAGKQNLHLKLALFNHPVWQMFLPSLESFSGANFEGVLSSDPQKIGMSGNISRLLLGEMQLDSLNLDVQSDTNKLNYALSVNEINDGSLQIHKTILKGDAANNNMNLNLTVQDAADKDKYYLAGLLKFSQDSYKFSFKKDSLLLNYQQWHVPEDNYIQYGPKGITAHNLKIENNGQYLLINSPQQSPEMPMEVDFHQFKLETLTKIAANDTAYISGLLNGKVVTENLVKEPVFTADLKIDSLAIKDQPVGNIALKVNNKTANEYNVDMRLTGNSNDLKATGIYYTQPQSKFDFNISIPALTMASAQAFSFGQVKDGSGILTGKLHLQGTTDAPRINGILTFKNAALTVTKVNDYLRMPDESIRFDDQGIHFDHFTIIDSLDNKAFVDGDVLTNNFKNYRFALNLTANNFRALNAKRSQDELYYGPVFIDANVRVRGDENLPKVDMDLKMNKNSILTVVLPGSNPAVESSDGIVEFIDASHINDTVKLALPADTIKRSELKGIQLSANISVDTAAVLNLIIDPTNGDNLRVKGDATLNMTMDPSGKISLTGRYEISEGAYRMSLERLIKRKFDIEKGSTITWTGDPTSAELDLKAVYNVETSAMELVEDQLTDKNEMTKNTYKQKLPFEVYLNIKGELMKPDISFSLDMPETSRNAFSGSVYTRINQINQSESEVNKQVLGLLVLGHFIADNPFKSAGGGGAEQLVRQSASKILSQQLNNLAGDLIKGVDLNFDLESSEDYSTGQAENKTNLNVGVSKSLFNGRTTVYVGSNIQLEGPQQADHRSSQIVGDVAIEYKLSRDGRYRLRGYRKNKYEGVIEGEFIETGLSFIIVMDYDHFRELFHSPKRRQKSR